MELYEVISAIRSKFRGFDSPASEEDLSDLSTLLGVLQDEIRALYTDHNGSKNLPASAEALLGARLMPIAEVVETHDSMRPVVNALPKAGEVALLWTDDNSNYCGIYIDGPLAGWICVLDHEEPMLTPAFRSSASFLGHLLTDAVRGDATRRACGLSSLQKEIPETVPGSQHIQSDRALASLFRQRCHKETNEDQRRLYAICSIYLTPVEDTGDVLVFLREPDMWTPEAAIQLLELRRWRGDVEQIEELAREGWPNGDGAAMRLLAQMNTDQSEQAITRLKQVLQGQKLQRLQWWMERTALP